MCACALLLPRLAAAEQRLTLDFDGDGQRDQVVLDSRQPSVLHVWLSASDSHHVIRSRAPILGVVATDLDGDHRPELIARDSESRIHVWTRKHNKFRRVHARRVVPGMLTHPSRHSVDDHDRGPASAITTTTVSFALTLCASPRAPALAIAPVSRRRSSGACRRSPAADPLAPRPPPTHTLV